MRGSHKVATLGYFSLAAVGSAFALQQTLYIADLSEDKAATAEPKLPYQTKTQMIAETPTAIPANPVAHLHLSLQQAEAALAAVDELDNQLASESTLSPKAPKPENTSAWLVNLEKQKTPNFMLRDEIREYNVVTLDKDNNAYPAQGDQMLIPLLDGEQVLVDVKNSKVNGNGDYSWSGHVQGFGTDYPVIMTYGKNSTFAMITTPKGSYSMESVNGVGWLYKNPAEHELTSPGHEDFLEVPEHRRTHSHTDEEHTMES